MYVDLLGSGMITYSDKLAAFLHTTPLAMFVMLPMASVASVSVCRPISFSGAAFLWWVRGHMERKYIFW